MIHLFVGDSVYKQFSRFGSAKQSIVFKEVLVSGPTPLSIDGWFQTRAKHISEDFDTSYDECLKSLHAFDNTISTLTPEQELICWFGHDLHCQVGFLYILKRLGELGHSNISLVSPPPISEGSYCFADVPAAELNDLLQKRVGIDRTLLQQAAMTWHLFCSPDPLILNSVFDGSIDVGPRFAALLELQANRFPSTIDGLGAIERKLLGCLLSGPLTFHELFVLLGKKTPEYHWGDQQFLNLCWRLLQGVPPLLSSNIATKGDLSGAILQVTDKAQALLLGELIPTSFPRYWLGGCELIQGHPWQWNKQNRRIVL